MPEHAPIPPVAQIPPYQPVQPELPSTTYAPEEPEEPAFSTISPQEVARLKHEEMQRKYKEEMEKRQEEHKKKVEELKAAQQKERERMMAEREKAENERRIQYEKEMRQRAEVYKMKMRMTTTPTPTTTIETTTEYIPMHYPTVPIREVVYDADVRRPIPTSKSLAEPIVRPIIENVTPASLSLEDIIAMDNQRSDYEDEYDVPMDFPDTEAPPLTTRAPPVTVRYTPPPPPIPHPKAPINGGMSPIVMPPTGGKKSKLFAPPSSEEYTQEVDFDPYVDFVKLK
uniref:CCDC66 domain-containing protein n=1 Tax=Caenorhabditis tropicalis TaxID=1561998 RepID=A0A1I7T4M7_9PELO